MADMTEGIALICPVVFPEDRDRILPERNIIKKDEKFLKKLYREDREGLEGFLEMGVIINQKTYERYKREIYSGIKSADMDFVRKLRNNYSFSFDVDKKIGKNYSKPSLFLAGKQDNITGYRQLENLCEDYSRGTIAVIDGAGHNLQIEEPEILNRLIENWLERAENN